MSKKDKETRFEIPNFELPKMEVPAAFRDLAEKTIAQSKENYDRFKQVAEETSDVLETAYGAYSKGTLELTSKLLDNAQDNVNALFDFTKSFMESKTVAEAFEKQATFTRKQVEAVAKQTQEIQKLATQAANDISEPLASAAKKATTQFNKKSAVA